MNLYILKFNNYYNRIVKFYNTLAEYPQPTTIVQNCNFIPADGISTTQIVNAKDYQLGDYLLAIDSDGLINSRWFILEAYRMLTGQYKLTLRRDVVADKYTKVINSPVFIKKATVGSNDPAIFNNENMGFNQIKTSETFLKDETQSAWVVGYIPKNSFTEDTEVSGSITLEGSADITVNSLADWEYNQYQTQRFKCPVTQSNIKYNILGLDIANTPLKFTFNSSGPALDPYWQDGLRNIGWASDVYRIYDDSKNLTMSNTYVFKKTSGTNAEALNSASEEIYKMYSDFDKMLRLANVIMESNDALQANDIKNMNGKILYDNSTKIYYKINTQRHYVTYMNRSIGAGELYNYMSTNFNKNALSKVSVTGNSSNYTFSFSADNVEEYTIKLEELQVNAVVTLNNDRYHLIDQPYDMFAIPYSDELKIKQNGVDLFTSNKQLAINMAIAIGEKTGSANLYDIQLLPYCPVRYVIKEDGSIDVSGVKCNYIRDGANPKNIGVIFWATTSNFTFDIPYNITIDDIKISNECDLYRLVSPNYNGQFEFSPAKNGGVRSFNVDCTYKPFNPYIHINPNFGSLYGKDFNDARGLICQGDFSLTQISNAWANYELNNKNYQNIFDRQIQNMEFNNSINNVRQAIGGVASAFGVGVGASMVGGAGAGVGAGVASILGAGADLALSKLQQQEQLDYTRDLYGYQLGNIKALPNSISKTSALTYNNKIFPILEYYTCTTEEREALKNKLKYNGMTIMRIGLMANYLQADYSYIQCQLIRYEDDFEDTHFVNEIAKELNMGVFIK